VIRLRPLASAVLVLALAVPPAFAESGPVQLLPPKMRSHNSGSSLFDRAARLFRSETEAPTAPAAATGEPRTVKLAPRIPALPRPRPQGDAEADTAETLAAEALPDETLADSDGMPVTQDSSEPADTEPQELAASPEEGATRDSGEAGADAAAASDLAQADETAAEETPAEIAETKVADASAVEEDSAPAGEATAQAAPSEEASPAQSAATVPAEDATEDADAVAALDAQLAEIAPIPPAVVAAALKARKEMETAGDGPASGQAMSQGDGAEAASAGDGSGAEIAALEDAASLDAVMPAGEAAAAAEPEPVPDDYELFLSADTVPALDPAVDEAKDVRVIDLAPEDGGPAANPGPVELARSVEPREEERLARVRKLAMAKAFDISPDAFFRPVLREQIKPEQRDIFVPFYEPTPDEMAIEETITGSVAAPSGNSGEGEGEPAFEPLAVPARSVPRELVQRLQSLQDEIAKGSMAAFNAQRTLLEEIGTKFNEAPAETWQDPRNAAALVTYVLSGGRPDLLATLLSREPLPALDEQLMRGALAYVEGRGAEARTFLEKIDARDFPGSMGSQVAIAQAALELPEKPKSAAAHLDMARLLSPGTLAEEAAIRREIIVLAQIEDTDRFQHLSRQYMQRFRHSIYAGNFRQRFAAALTRMSFMDDPRQFHRLDDILAEMEPDARLELYLVIARALVVQAKAEPAKLAAQRVLDLSEAGTPDAERALLYRAAATVATPDGLDAGLNDLAAVNLGALPQADRELYNMVSATAELIRTAAEAKVADLGPAAGARAGANSAPQPVSPDTASDATAGATPGAASDEAGKVMARAEEALKVVDTLLGEAK